MSTNGKGIDFSTSFGARNARQSTQNLPKAQFWLNFGIMKAATKEGEEDRFVSLPTGIPLDTMEPAKVSGNNRDWNKFQAARNDLLAQILDVANTLEPGGEFIIQAEGELAIQIRRVSAEAEEPAVDETNRYATPSLFKVAGAK